MVAHLSWLLEFSELLGCEGIARPAARVLASARVGRCAQLLASVNQLVTRVRRTPLLDRRLRGVGCVHSTTETLRGPVARASGRDDDVRKEDPAYAALGFAPVLEQGGDARSRLWVRLAELEQSVRLLDRAGESLPESPQLPADFSGSAEVQLEAPRGRAALRVDVRDGAVVSAALDTPSSVHLELVSGLCADQELSDALVAVSSLDLSLWEVDR
jgi:Ni,Fe-hydrogenase III large subunit